MVWSPLDLAVSAAFLAAAVACRDSPVAILLVFLSALCVWFAASPADWVIPPPAHARVGPRQAGSPRCPYPSGWYVLALSDKLPANAVLPARVGSNQLVLWRGGAGTPPRVFDAHCPHLGAHLAVGGMVDAGCLRCPFHAWRFDANGVVVGAPGCETAPPARVRSWPCVERNGQISVWMDAAHDHRRSQGVAGSKDDAPAGTVKVHPRSDGSPSYDLPTVPELNDDAAWRFHGRMTHTVRCSLLEIPENGSDVAHLPALHGAFLLPSIRFLGHAWTAAWTPRVASPPSPGQPLGDGALVDISITEAITCFGRRIPGTFVQVAVLQVGVTQVFLDLRTPIGRVIIVETVTPHGPLEQSVVHSVFAPPSVPRLVATLLLAATRAQFDRDVPIWNNKRYEASPTLSGADKSIAAFRRWAGRFIPAGAISFGEAAAVAAADAAGMPSGASVEW